MTSNKGGSLLAPPPRDGETQLQVSEFSIRVGAGTAGQLQRNRNLVFKCYLRSRHIVFTQFWGSLGETRERSGTLKLSPATPILPLGHIKVTSTLSRKPFSGSPGLLGQVQIAAGGQVPARPRWPQSGAPCLLLISTGHPMLLSFLKEPSSS